MALDYPNIVPQNNLRLPDAMTIKHGPAPLLARFVLAADREARERGVSLRLRYDFDELVYLNRQETTKGNWYELPHMFDPQHVELTPENAYWISGENEDGEIVAVHAAHVYYWPDTSLRDEARALFYGHDTGQPCLVTANAADLISGLVWNGGAAWVRPDYRGRQLSHILPRVLKAYASGRWPIDWFIGYVKPALVAGGVARGYGSKHLSYSISYPGSPWGDVEFALVYTSVSELYEDLADNLVAELSNDRGIGPAVVPAGTFLERSVTNTSADGVFQGSNSLS